MKISINRRSGTTTIIRTTKTDIHGGQVDVGTTDFQIQRKPSEAITMYVDGLIGGLTTPPARLGAGYTTLQGSYEEIMELSLRLRKAAIDWDRHHGHFARSLEPRKDDQ